jgi:tetratricopeptide (TPR) repeat protein
MIHTDRSRNQRRVRSAQLLLAILAALCLMLPSAARADEDAEDGPGIPPEWVAALEAYPRDPAGNRAAILAIEREAGGQLPPQIQVYIADAHLRAGQVDAAERALRATLESNPPYPWDMFAKLGMGGALMMRGDSEGAEPYFSDVANADQESARLFGNLGLGHALLASDRPMDAKAAFDAAGSNKAVDEQFRQAGKFGSATSLYAAGDYKGAAEAFDALAASDPKGQIGLDARYAAARARLAMGDRAEAITALEGMESRCATEKTRRRAPRTLRNLDGRAFGRAWLRNYQRMGLYEALGRDTTMYTIGGCDLARSTLRQIKSSDGRSDRGLQTGLRTGRQRGPGGVRSRRPESCRPWRSEGR